MPLEVSKIIPDSWLISVWVETGIVGLILYLSIHSILFAWCSWIPVSYTHLFQARVASPARGKPEFAL